MSSRLWNTSSQGKGSIGRDVVEQLLEDGHEVLALTRSRSNATHLPNEVTVVEGNITDKETMRQPMAGVDRVFHMAAWWFIAPGPRNRETAERINVGGTRNGILWSGGAETER